VGKVLERVVAAWMEMHMSQALSGLQEGQYGFRRGRSTTDAIVWVRSLVQETERRGWVALAVSLDIMNAFNSLPWEKIGEALEFHRVLHYLQRVVPAYLRDRCILYTGRER
jgi:retron-type reverse transcriptase